ncbi:uracil-DNA glycosylase [Aphelenchoides avenae]|nr:uracil-DNA glycosylase [Aphelenchus avenae]
MLKYLIRGASKRTLASSITTISEVISAAEAHSGSANGSSPDAKRRKEEVTETDEAFDDAVASSSHTTTVKHTLVTEQHESSNDPLKEINAESPKIIVTGETEEIIDVQNVWTATNAMKDSEWKELLSAEFGKPYMKTLFDQLNAMERKGVKIYPPKESVFTAFNVTPFSKIRVVLLGQDPYHNESQAHGLCFSVQKGVPPPPSLKNIYKELKAEFPHFAVPEHGHLVSWAKQGVFMLNATLTVEAHKANSHSKLGWQRFTDSVIKTVSQRSESGVVFLLWGGFAHKKEELVDTKKHVVIKTAHPSPLSYRKFQGCKCFGKVNEALAKLGHPPIDWTAL